MQSELLSGNQIHRYGLMCTLCTKISALAGTQVKESAGTQVGPARLFSNNLSARAQAAVIAVVGSGGG